MLQYCFNKKLQVSSLSLKTLEGASADLAEIEQIVKERMVRNCSLIDVVLFLNLKHARLLTLFNFYW